MFNNLPCDTDRTGEDTEHPYQSGFTVDQEVSDTDNSSPPRKLEQSPIMNKYQKAHREMDIENLDYIRNDTEPEEVPNMYEQYMQAKNLENEKPLVINKNNIQLAPENVAQYS